MLKEINCKLDEARYVLDITNVLLDVDLREKEHLISRYSQKPAMTLGLITIGQGMPIRVAKNLRICCECHSFAKPVSDYTKGASLLEIMTGIILSSKDFVLVEMIGDRITNRFYQKRTKELQRGVLTPDTSIQLLSWLI